MVYLMTNDSFLFQGFSNLQKMRKINTITDLSAVVIHPSDILIIDAYHNNVLDEQSVTILRDLDVTRIIILAPFHISKIKSNAPLFFINRKERMENILSLLTDNNVPYRKPKVGLSHNQFKIVSYILKQENLHEITTALNISEQTLRTQKFNIMFKLKLRRMSDIVTLNISPYFCH